MIRPTVGRVMWFYAYSPGQGHKGPQAAHVAYVHSPSIVNLMVINETGVPRSETRVRLLCDNEEAPASKYCCWMPYQVGQAVKTQELQKQLDELKLQLAEEKPRDTVKR